METLSTKWNTITTLQESRKREGYSGQDDSKEKKKGKNPKTYFHVWLEKFDWKQVISADTVSYWKLEVKSKYFSQGNYLKIIVDVPFFVTFFFWK